MSSTQTATTTSNKNVARIFLIGVGNTNEQKELDDLWLASLEGGSLPPFLLNSSDFVKLQQYVHACTELPDNGAHFEADYPREHMLKFFKGDEEVYELMKIDLPIMHQRASAFQAETLMPMISLGGSIAVFAKEAVTLTGRIVDALNKMEAPGLAKNSTQFNSAKNVATVYLKRLIDYTVKVESQCEGVLKQLAKFKTETQTKDKANLERICTRLEKLKPTSDTEKKKLDEARSVLKLMIDQFNAIWAWALKVLEEESQKARENGENRWYRSIVASEKSENDQVVKQIKDANKAFEDFKTSSLGIVAQLAAQSHQLDTLFKEIKDVENTINGAIEAVNNMYTGFADMKKNFGAILTKLTAVNSDVEDAFFEEYQNQKDDMVAAAKTWRIVEHQASVFAKTGLVLPADGSK
ncbi:hypothetical protein P154DRAFT_575412 [Amniculicola lignicola CBS 123094]|uniref:Uncharacterized protein n=1 Tax=Amniculicola lignicola CBS 123094 TaxID=1392246 RepID=A0A6A5WLJ9_9PLEO|nr:hypothetical protein P154DRAFT_575412 [Amniculicola lignicola CBS 123094]